MEPFRNYGTDTRQRESRDGGERMDNKDSRVARKLAEAHRQQVERNSGGTWTFTGGRLVSLLRAGLAKKAA